MTYDFNGLRFSLELDMIPPMRHSDEAQRQRQRFSLSTLEIVHKHCGSTSSDEHKQKDLEAFSSFAASVTPDFWGIPVPPGVLPSPSLRAKPVHVSD